MWHYISFNFSSSDTDYCLDETGEYYILCLPTKPLYQVYEIFTNNSYVDIYDQIPNSVTAVLTICYVAISLVAIVGNSLVMYVVCVSRSISYCKLDQCVFPSSGECKLWPTSTSQTWPCPTWSWPSSASPSSSGPPWCRGGTCPSSCVSSVRSCKHSRYGTLANW